MNNFFDEHSEIKRPYTRLENMVSAFLGLVLGMIICYVAEMYR